MPPSPPEAAAPLAVALGPEPPSSPPPENSVAAIEGVLARHGLAEPLPTIMPRRRDDAHADVRVFLGGPAAAARAAEPGLLRALEALPQVETVKPRQTTLSVRLADAFVERVGRALQRGATPGLDSASTGGDGRRYLVGFAGPNSSKALHLGHLRNVITGNALAAALKAAGRACEAYSLVGDIGRNVCEAMAGYRLFHDGEDPRLLGVKPDHFVGRCYQEYLGSREAAAGAGVEPDPCGREHVPAADLADDLLARWRAGDPDTRALWAWVRAEVEAGHDETLAALGVTLDRRYYESEHVEAGLALVERARRMGLLERLETGTLVFDTGRPEYRRLVLVRSDGFPTEHGRILGVFQRVFAERPGGCVHVDWNGTEWEPAQAAIAELMAALGVVPKHGAHLPVFHGMLLLEGREMSSSSGEPVLIDELLARVRESPEVVALAGDAAGRAAVADVVTKGFFLSAPLTRPLSFSYERLMDPAANRGWVVAHAWCRTAAGRAEAQGSAAQPSYRWAVLQWEAFPPVLAHAARTLDVAPLMRFVARFCEGYLAGAPDPAVDAAARTVLGAALSSLGFHVGVPRGTAAV